MFTGIITDIGTIRSAEQRGDLRLVIGCGYDMTGVDLGASIACSGVCLTVIDKGRDTQGGWFAVDVSGETQRCTAALAVVCATGRSIFQAWPKEMPRDRKGRRR